MKMAVLSICWPLFLNWKWICLPCFKPHPRWQPWIS